MSDQAASATAPGTGEGEGQAQQGTDLSQIADQLSGLTESQEQMRQYLASNPWAAQEAQPEAQEEQVPELDLGFLDDPTLDSQQLAEKLGGLIDQSSDQRLQNALQEHIGPLRSELQNLRMESEAERLTQEFPELGEPETAEKVVGTARQYAELMGQPELANNVAFWRLVYMAGRAAETANSEDAGMTDAAHLEGAGGAGLAGSQQVDLGKLITDGGDDGALGRRALPF